MNTPRQGIPLVTAICVLIGILVVIQLWLLSAALDALLSDHLTILVPAAAASSLLFLASGGLYLHVRNFDRRVRDRGSNGEA